MNMNINWYPGHMKKTMDQLKVSLKLVDVVVEVIDSRVPISSRNPNLDRLLENKPRIMIMNKMDLADPKQNEMWANHFKKEGYGILMVDAVRKNGLNKLYSIAKAQIEEKTERNKRKKIIDPNIRMMIIGIPNVGKSTIINAISNRRGTQVGNRPGVTRANQWIKTPYEIELLDTPGVLWPKFEDEKVGLHLAFTGAISDNVLDIENLSYELIKTLNEIDPNILVDRYGIQRYDQALDTMDAIGRKRGYLIKGNEIDYTKVGHTLLNEFRRGVLGRITLEQIKE